jgi:hypothetical protein
VIPEKSYSVDAVNYLEYLVDAKEHVSIRNGYSNTSDVTVKLS